jgi:APA family basic amino acid/polyamine antiporter
MLVGIFRTKSIEEYQSDVKNTHLRREMGALDVTMLGIGVIVGTGIFVLTGVAAAKYAGPALMVSFLMAGITCGFVSLVYSELASMVSVAGSAYAYAYASERGMGDASANEYQSAGNDVGSYEPT